MFFGFLKSHMQSSDTEHCYDRLILLNDNFGYFRIKIQYVESSMQTLHIHHRQSILLGLALPELTIPLKITPRSSYTSLLNQDGYVLYYKIFSFPPPAWLPHSLSIAYNLATWKHLEGNYLPAIQDIHRNCSFLRQGGCAWEGGRHEHRAGEPGQALPQPLLYFWLASWFLWVLQPTWGFGRGPVFLRSYLCLLDWCFLPPELWQMMCCADGARICTAQLLGSPVVWLGLITSADTWWQFC